jgi:hypothetical protein
VGFVLNPEVSATVQWIFLPPGAEILIGDRCLGVLIVSVAQRDALDEIVVRTLVMPVIRILAVNVDVLVPVGFDQASAVDPTPNDVV